MKKIGITGGIGSGKTTVCAVMERLGARVFYADDEGKKLLVEDPEARSEVIASFGKNAYQTDGTLNRKYLASRVFGNADKLSRLNGIVHPRVRKRFEEFVEKAEKDEVDMVVYEAALIFETGGDQRLDGVVAVTAPEKTRIERVQARDGSTADEIRDRMQHQLTDDERRAKADWVIENDGVLECLERETKAVYWSILSAKKVV